MRRWVAGGFVLLFAFWFFVQASSLPVSSARSAAQYALLPLLLVWLWRIPVRRLRPPRMLVFATTGLALLASVQEYALVPSRKPAVVHTRLADDPMETISRILRKRVADAIGTNSPEVIRYNAMFESARAARVWLDGQPAGTQAVIWGSPRWVNVSLRKAEVPLLGDLLPASAGSALGRLQVIQSIPAFGLSLTPEVDTARFLADFFAGLGPRPFNLAQPDLAGEMDLRSAMAQRSPWTSFSHLAAPAFFLGNRYLAWGLMTGETGFFRCAAATYRQGLSKLRWGDNRELWAALNNNTAVALVGWSVASGDQRLLREARRYLKAGVRAATQPNVYDLRLSAPAVARANLVVLRSVTVGPEKRRVGQRRAGLWNERQSHTTAKHVRRGRSRTGGLS